MEPLYNAWPLVGNKIFSFIEALPQGSVCTLGHSKVAFIEGRPHVRGGDSIVIFANGIGE